MSLYMSDLENIIYFIIRFSSFEKCVQAFYEFVILSTWSTQELKFKDDSKLPKSCFNVSFLTFIFNNKIICSYNLRDLHKKVENDLFLFFALIFPIYSLINDWWVFLQKHYLKNIKTELQRFFVNTFLIPFNVANKTINKRWYKTLQIVFPTQLIT